MNGGLDCLEEVIRSGEISHLYYQHFFVMRLDDGTPVASCSCYPYPDYDVSKTYICLEPIVMKKFGWSKAEFDAHVARLDFLKEAFPENVPWKDSWFLETIYTEPEYRGRGLSSELIQRCLEEGRRAGAPRSILLAAQGNDKAQRVYLKQGYEIIGHVNAEADKAHAYLGCGGFDIFKLEF